MIYCSNIFLSNTTFRYINALIRMNRVVNLWRNTILNALNFLIRIPVKTTSTQGLDRTITPTVVIIDDTAERITRVAQVARGTNASRVFTVLATIITVVPELTRTSKSKL